MTIGVVLFVYSPLMAAIRLRGYAGMLALLLASWTAGWLLGSPGADNRRALALTTSLRNVGVGLVIATGNFGGTAAVTAVLAYGIFEIVGSVLLALAWGRVHWLAMNKLNGKPASRSRSIIRSQSGMTWLHGYQLARTSASRSGSCLLWPLASSCWWRRCSAGSIAPRAGPGSTSPRRARDDPGSVQSSMLTFVVFVVSSLLIVVQLASAQLTPRIIAMVFADRRLKWVLRFHLYLHIYHRRLGPN